MKLHKYLFIAAGMALVAGFTSCDEGGLDYEYVPAETPTGAQVYFDSADNGTVISLTDGQTSMQLPVYRLYSDGDLTVNISLTDESGLLSLANNGAVTFAAGSKQAMATVNVNFAAMQPNTQYPFSISLPAADASEYAVSTLSAKFEFAPWTEWTKLGTGTYILNGAWAGAEPDLDIMWRQSLIDPNAVEFSIPDLYIENYGLNFSGTKTTDEEGNTVYILNVPEQSTGCIYEDLNALIYCSDLYHYTGQEDYKDLSVYEPENGLFALAMLYYIPNQGKFGNGAYEYFQLDGFTTYEIDLTEAGHFVAPDGTDHAIVQYHYSDGVKSMQYTAVAGQLASDAEVEQVVAGMIDGSIESKTAETADGYMAFAFPEKGTYTVVAAGFDDAGNLAVTEVLELLYIPVGSEGAPNVDDDPDWTTLGYCTYTDDFLPALTNQISPETCDVKIQVYNGDDADIFRLVNAYGPDGYGFPLADPTQNYFMEINIMDEAGHVILDTNDQGVQPFNGYGNMYTTCMAVQQLANGAALADVLASGICGTYQDGFIHFPTDQLMIGLVKPDGSLAGWTANKNGAFEIDMSQLISEQRAHRTSVRRPVRVYGNPTAKMVVKKHSFLSNVTTDQILKQRKSRLNTNPIR